MRGITRHTCVLLSTTLAVGCVADVPASPSSSSAHPPARSEAALSSNEVNAYNYFISQGLSAAQSAGIVGNLMQESDVDPTIAQYGGGPGRGIAQWSVGGRWDTSSDDNVLWYAGQNNESSLALDTQLAFIWYELTTFGYGYGDLQAATDVTTATVVFMDDYEICGTCAEATRIAFAEQVYDTYTGGSGSTGGTATCYSGTLGEDVAANTCVQSKYDGDWYQCDNGAWVDRWTDPDACVAVYPL
jgi:hypothetical protein